MSLGEYRRKRKFHRTPEPPPRKAKARGGLRFIVHKHAATRLHFDLRLEVDGVLVSWAVPKGPSDRVFEPRLAVKVEDHPLAYGDFEGIIPEGNYGAGTVMIWDRGTYVSKGAESRAASEAAMREGILTGKLSFVLSGEKLQGEFTLVKVKGKGRKGNEWLLIKKPAPRAPASLSAASGLSMEEIAAAAPGKGKIWSSSRRNGPRDLGGKKASLPHRIHPMVPRFSPAPVEGADWAFEGKGEGSRAIAEVEGKRAHLYSRQLSLEGRYPEIIAALQRLGKDLVLDGQVSRVKGHARFLASDLLYVDGEDLRDLPFGTRRKRLEGLGTLSEPLAVAPLALSPAELSVPAGDTVVAKRIDSPYRSGVTKDWLWFKSPGTARGKNVTKPSDRPPLSHPDKIFWPKERITKGDLFAYYETVADTILPYLVDRPQSMHRQPDGILSEGFFHKDVTGYVPRRVATERITSRSAGRTLRYLLCQDQWSLLYLVNLGCIELNPWISRRGTLERPDYAVIDIDPDGNAFGEVVKVALEVKKVLDGLGLRGWCKTSGATGLHIYVPTNVRADFDTTRLFAEKVCAIVHERLPEMTSMERNPARRRRRIYLDYLQNRRGQTMAAPYCVRPRPGATISAPLEWREVKPGLDPRAFTMKTMPLRIQSKGDLWADLADHGFDIEAAVKALSRDRHNPIKPPKSVNHGTRSTDAQSGGRHGQGKQTKKARP